MNVKVIWVFLTVFSVALAGVILWVWFEADSAYRPNEDQLVDAPGALRFLEQEWSESGRDLSELPPLIPTGVFIQSLKFNSSADVNMTGYVWQKYKTGAETAAAADHGGEACELGYRPAAGGPARGFILPEAIDSSGNVEPRVAYAEFDPDTNTLLCGWYFEATLRQKFDYTKYPLDHKTVWLRMWHYDFGHREALLVPDLSAYKATNLGDAFGLDRDIVLGGWGIEETFFDFKTPGYDTDFGYAGPVVAKPIPELYFNIVIKRRFLNAFIVNLVPLMTVSALLFAVLMTVSADPDKAALLGFNTSGLVGVCSALFFVVMLAHIQLRQQFAGAGIVYLEYFYFIVYLAVVAVTVNSYLFSIGRPWIVLQYRDNLIPKMLFWPLLLGSGAVVTLAVLP